MNRSIKTGGEACRGLVTLTIPTDFDEMLTKCLVCLVLAVVYAVSFDCF